MGRLIRAHIQLLSQESHLSPEKASQEGLRNTFFARLTAASQYWIHENPLLYVIQII